jgi:hypothetical protein
MPKGEQAWKMRQFSGRLLFRPASLLCGQQPAKSSMAISIGLPAFFDAACAAANSQTTASWVPILP